MASKVIMPKLSPTMEEGQIARWLKKEGDKVSMGEPLAEIDTDKATMEMQALADGVLRKILLPEGQSAPLGQLIAIIGQPDEDISAIESKVSAAQPQAQAATPAPTAAPEASSSVPNAAAHAATASTASAGNGRQGAVAESASSGRLIVSPLAARMAAEAGIDLRSLSGSGPGGRIIKRDIEAAMSGAGTKAEAPAKLRIVQPLQKAAVVGASAYRDEPLTVMRKTIRNRLAT